MEDNCEKIQECSLKIDAIWSETDESLFIKEEIISDFEPDNFSLIQENTNSCVENQIDVQTENEGNFNGYLDTQLLLSWHPLKKKVKSKYQKSEESEVIFNHKLSCMHDTKNFKIVKRRLRCGDCKILVCPECCKVMIPNFQSHFLGSGICSSGTYLCKLCSIIFHSLCALQAHIRIHTMDTPYVCPDCGLIYNNIYFLILHLLNKCYHVYKIVRYKCKQCPGVYFTPETFVQHIQERHIYCVFRCLYCSSLFSNYDEFNYHMENFHQKQKVQYLNYFRCSLCSNMVIPRFMYQRHVAQHRENSEFYEVDYQCPCGETYSLIGAFRTHFSYCSKKGVLPPKWSFLQKKLKTHDIVHHENFSKKEVVIQPLPVYPNNDVDFKNLSFIGPHDKGEIGNWKIGQKNNNCEGPVEATVKSTISEIDSMDLYEEENEKSKEESETWNNANAHFKNLLNSTSLNQVQSPDITEGSKTVLEYFDKSETEISTVNEETKAYLEKKSLEDADSGSLSINNKNDEENGNCKSNREWEQTDCEISKIYDHIPCDHLGYVIKTQCPEPNKKSCQDNEIVEKSYSPKSLQIITELDEKTGLITTKTVSLNDLEIDEEENINENDYNMESYNFSATTRQYSNDKVKFKVGTSLSCPFCVVIFPKHNLTFQQFRLHLESYHPNAALNITVNKEPKKICIDKLEDANAENKIKDLNCSKSDTENRPKFSSSSNHFSNLDNCEKEYNSQMNQNEVNQDPCSITSIISSKEGSQCEAISNVKTFKGEDKENLTEKSNIFFKRPNESVCQTNKSSSSTKDRKVQSWKLEDCAVNVFRPPMDSNSENEEFEFMKDEKKEKNKATTDKSDEDSNTNEEKDNDDYDELLKQNSKTNEEADQIEGILEKTIPEESGNKISSESLFDFDYEGETSKESNWSEISGKYTKATSFNETKIEEKERFRRESEVWSEFYESLMLAEKLKKRKNTSPESESNKKLVVSDYSSKRVVKKPKRYRESSESADSNENSESEDELLENDFIDKIYSEEKGDAKNQLNKKQMLLDKLENVDGRFVDYLFDLVIKKEKLFELYKKHSTIRADPYRHDLRSYCKKVLNGIKQRGRPLKILRYHEILRKKMLCRDKNEKDSYQSKKKSEFLIENKTNEKKRGRPRKYHDPAKLKERRRSDKEVDFIEKNFEREDSDLSPSKRKRKLSSKLQYYRKMSDEKDDFSSGQVITNKVTDSSKKFTCAVCRKVFPELIEFRDHIVIHRMEENTYQCMECGECFVVRPSLEKHLHAFHKIKNTDKYIADNHCCNIKKEIIEIDSEPLKENQCKVCKDQFDRPIDLTKHFRIHGMAFLKEFKKEGKQNEKRNF